MSAASVRGQDAEEIGLGGVGPRQVPEHAGQLRKSEII
jgi:hypothetical protein